MSRLSASRLLMAAAVFAAACVSASLAGPVGRARAQEVVDLELVLAVDISRSMDFEEQIIQRNGYAAAFRSDEVIEAILGGGTGRIAVTYMQWAGDGLARVIIPWTLIDSREKSLAFAGELEMHQPLRLSRTSISSGLAHAQTLFGASGWKGVRRVVDVSGDGPNNQGTPVELLRDALVGDGIVINGLPLMVRTSTFGFGIDNLDEYYFDCVIGGTGSFVIPVHDWDGFPEAVRRKLVLEIAGDGPRAVPASAHPAAFDDPGREKVDCMVGEKLWQMRMRDLEWR